MRLKPVYILTGPVHTGKTGTLAQWIGRRSDAEGLLAPDADGLRLMKDTANGETWPFQVEHEDRGTVRIGQYIFSLGAFRKAQSKLLSLCHEHNGFIVVDEIGKLELQGRGLAPALDEFLRFHHQSNTPLVLVVRDYLVDEVISHYQLENVKIITAEEGLGDI